MPIGYTPGYGASKVFGNAFEEVVVDWCRRICKFAKGGDRVADVATTGDIGIEEFAEEGAIAKTFGVFKSSVFIGVLRRTSRGVVHGWNGIHGERGDMGRRGFGRGRGIPAVGFQ